MSHRVGFPVVSWSCGVVLLALAALAARGEEATAPPATAPTITAPSGSGNSTLPTVSWSAVDNATVYDLWIDNVTDNVFQVFRQSDITSTSLTLTTALPDNHSFKAWIRAGNSAGWSSWSAAQAFATGTAPVGPPTGVPAITAPIGSGQSTLPTFSWTASDSDFFDLWVDDVRTGTSQIIRNTHVLGTTFVPATPLPYGDSFRAYVRGGNCLGWTSWSAAANFATDGGPVAPPTAAPAFVTPSGRGNGTTPEFTWTAVTGATMYDFWLDDLTVGTSQLIRQTQISGTTFTPSTPLADNHSFQAWVRGGNGYGYGPWSATRAFATGDAPIAPPTYVPALTAPTGRYNTTTPEFDWTTDATVDSSFYDLWVDDMTTGTSQVLRQTHLAGASFVPATPLPDAHSFRAWIRGGNVYGYGPWSPARDFSLPNAPVALPTAAPVVSAPSGSGNTTTPTVMWNDVTDATFFDLWVDDVTLGASQVVRNTHVTDTSYAITTPLADNHSFKIWVRAGNCYGFGPWSATQVFATGTAPIEPPTGAPVITAPSGNNNPLLPQFVWTTVATATVFDFWLDDITAGTSQLIREQSLSDTTFTPLTPLAAGHSFRAWVRAGNPLGLGPWSAAQDFATVERVNNAPVAYDDSYFTAPGETLNAGAYPLSGVLWNDSDPDGDPLTARRVNGPEGGTLDLHTDGTFTYAPPPDFHGTQMFTYVANDGLADSNVATAYIAVDAPPVPQEIHQDTVQDQFVTFDLVASDAENDTLWFTLGLPAHGSAQIVTWPSQVTYQPDGGFVGNDSFTYWVYDSFYRDGVSATVHITVARPNHAPIASPGTYTVEAGATLSDWCDASDEDGDLLAYAKASDPQHGAVTVNADGSFTYTSDQSYVGPDSFTFKANDGRLDSDPATVSLTVVNGPPVAQDQTVTVYRAQATLITLVATDPNGDPLSFTVSFPSHGTLSGTAPNLTYRSDQWFVGDDSFTYSVSDEHNMSVWATVNITVKAANHAPVANNDTYSVDAGATLTVDAVDSGLLANDSDEDGDEFVLYKHSQPAHGTLLTVNWDGTFVYKPDQGYPGTDSFTYELYDGYDYSGQATVTITVRDIQPPTIVHLAYLMDLGTLGGSGTYPYGMSFAGQVVGTSINAAGRYEAFTWKNGVMRALPGVFGNVGATAYGVNAGGQIAGYDTMGGGGSRAVLWSSGQVFDLFAGEGRAVNGSGQVAGTRSSDHHAVLWQNGWLTDLGTLPGATDSTAAAINDTGGVVGSSGGRAFFWGAGTMSELNAWGWTASSATAVNSLGQVAGAACNAQGVSHAVLWTMGTPSDLGAPGSAEDINNSGDIVGSLNNRATLWKNGLCVDLNSLLPAGSGWELATATCINDSGQVAGVGWHNGCNAGFFLQLLVFDRAAVNNSTITLEATQSGGAIAGGDLAGLAEDALTPPEDITYDYGALAKGTLLPVGVNYATVKARDQSGNAAPAGIWVMVTPAPTPATVTVENLIITGGLADPQRYTIGGQYVYFADSTPVTVALQVHAAVSYGVLDGATITAVGEHGETVSARVDGNGTGAYTFSTQLSIITPGRYEISATVDGRMYDWRAFSGSLPAAQRIVLCADNTPAAQFSEAASSGSESLSPASVAVVLGAPCSKTVTVRYALAGGTAVSTVDYNFAGGILTFTPRETAKQLSIDIIANSRSEPDKTIVLQLTPVQNAVAGAITQHVYTILDDDPPPVVSFATDSSIKPETKTPALLDVGLSSASGHTVTVDYGVSGGTASGNGVDFNLPDGTLVFPPGQTKQRISLDIVQDGQAEAPETVQVSLRSPQHATLGEVSAHTLTIVDPPVAQPQERAVDENASVAVTLAASDPAGCAITYAIVNKPLNGTLTGTAPNVTYAPNPHYSGSDSFCFAASNGVAESAPARVSITVNAVNAAPVAAGDEYVTPADTALGAAAPGVLGNDSDGEGDALSAVLMIGPEQGVLELAADGSFTYTPNAGFEGVDSFSYKVSDGALESAPATVSIAVGGTHAAPAFTNLFPPDGGWTNLRRPTVKADVTGDQLDFATLGMEIEGQAGAAWVGLGGMKPALNGNHVEMSLPYDLTEGTYQVSAAIANRAGQRGTSAWQFKIDLRPPVIEGLPASVDTFERRPAVSATYRDYRKTPEEWNSGIDVAGVTLILDEVDVTAEAAASETGVSFSPPSDLVFGVHVATLIVSDRAGNQASVHGTITVEDPSKDTTPPAFSHLAPANGAFVSTVQQAAIHVLFTDSVSGVNPALTKLTLDGQQVVPDAADATHLLYTLPANLTEGQHVYKVTIEDNAQNTAEQNVSFGVDNSSPVITTFLPSDASVAAVQTFSVVFEDPGGSGIDWQTLQLTVNGTDYTSRAQRNWDTLRLDLQEPLYGQCQTHISVRDRAGNLFETTKSRQTALSDFAWAIAGQTPEVWTPVPEPTFLLVWSNDTTYRFRAKYAEGCTPGSFEVVAKTGGGQSLPITHVPDTGDGYVYFDITKPAPLTQAAATLKISDAAQALEVQGFFGWYDAADTQAPVITLESPQGNTCPPYTHITASVTDNWWLQRVQLYVNGQPVSGAPYWDSHSYVLLDYTLETEGTVNFRIEATDYAGNTARFPAEEGTTFTCVVEYLPFVIGISSQPAAATKSPFNTLRFSVSSGFAGIATGRTRVSYTVNGGPSDYLTPVYRQSRTMYAECTQTFPVLPDGSLVKYTIHAEENARPGQATVRQANVSSEYLVDLKAPVVGAFNPPTGSVVSAGTPESSFEVDDFRADAGWQCSGLASFSASLCEVASVPVQVGCTNGVTAGTHVLVPTTPLVAGKGYRLTVTVYDRAGNMSTAEALYYAAGDTTAPTIEITPADQANAGTFAAGVRVQDCGSGVPPGNVTIALDGTVDITASAKQDAAKGESQYAFRLPRGTAVSHTTPHTLAVTATDRAGNTAVVTSTFFLVKPLPPVPIVEQVTAGTSVITVSGRIPVVPPDLERLVPAATGARINRIIFDRDAHKFEVQCVKTTASGRGACRRRGAGGDPDSGDRADFSLKYEDGDGLQGDRYDGHKDFAPGTAKPPAVQPLPDTAQPPDSAAPADDTAALTVYWNFDEANITGVTKAFVSGQGEQDWLPFNGDPLANLNYRGWVPCTKAGNGKVHIKGAVLGGEGPYTVQVCRDDSVIVEKQFPTTAFDIEAVFGKGRNEKVSVKVQDAAGLRAEYGGRSLYVDTQPLSLTPGEGILYLKPGYTCKPAHGKVGLWRWFYRHPATDVEDPTIFENAVVDEDVTGGSGVAAAELWWRTAGVPLPDGTPPTFSVLPRGMFEYGGWTKEWQVNGLPNGACKDCVYRGKQDGVVKLADRYELRIPMVTRLTDGAGNATEQFYGFYVPEIEDTGLPTGLPNVIEAGKPYLVAPRPDEIELSFTGIGIMDPATGKRYISVKEGEIAVVQVDSPGTYPITLRRIRSSDDFDTYERVLRVLKPLLVVDENNNGDTGDENPEGQQKHGVFVPINAENRPGEESSNGLRLVTFDPEIAEPAPNTVASCYPECAPNGGITWVEIGHSFNVRLWRTRDKKPGEELPWCWNLQDEAERKDFESLNGRLYVECLAEDYYLDRCPIDDNYIPVTSRYPSVCLMHSDPTQYHSVPVRGLEYHEPRCIYMCYGLDFGTPYYLGVGVRLHGVSDKNEGWKDGEASVPVAENAAVDLNYGSLKCVWPLARSGSAIIPDINVYYNSRDVLSGESNRRLLFPDRWSYCTGEDENGCYEFGYPPDLDTCEGDLGRRFRHSLEMRLFRGDKVIVVVDGDGRRVRYEPELDPDETKWTWKPEERKGDVGASIRLVSRTVFGPERRYYLLVRPAENRQYLFEEETGKLWEIRDPYDNWARLEYAEWGGTRGRLKAVVDNRGMFLTFSSDGSGNMTVTDARDRQACIAPSGITGPLGSFAFTLGRGNGVQETMGRADYIRDFTDTHGVKYLVNRDCTEKVEGVVYAVTRDETSGGDGRTMSFTYGPEGASVAYYHKAGDKDRTYTYQTDVQKNVWTQVMFNTDEQTPVTLSQGADAQGRVTSRTNLLRGESSFRYDENGKLVEFSDPDEKKRTWTYSLHPNPRGRADGPENFLEMILLLDQAEDGCRAVTTFDYGNEDVFLGEIRDPVGSQKITSWDRYGLPLAIEGPKPGYARALTYDNFGRPTEMTETGAGKELKTTYRNDALGQVREIVYPDARLLKVFYDQAGRRIGAEGPFLAENETGENTQDGAFSGVFRDQAGAWTKITDLNGDSVTREIGKMGEIKSTTNAAGGETKFEEFDPLLRPAKVKLPSPNDKSAPRLLECTYDLIGRLTGTSIEADIGKYVATGTTYKDSDRQVTFRNPRQFEFTTALSAAGRTAKTSGPQRFNRALEYDGNALRQKDGLEGLAASGWNWNPHSVLKRRELEQTPFSTEYERDETDYARKITLPGGVIVEQPQDEMGAVALVTAGGVQVSAAEFTEAKWPALPTTLKDLRTSHGGAAVTAISARDAYYNPAAWSSPVSSPVGPGQTIPGSAAYRGTGELLEMTDGEGHTSRNVFANGRYIGSKDQNEIGATREYAKSGHLKSVTDDRGKTMRYVYEEATGYLQAVIYPDGKGVVYTNNESGNPTKAVHAETVTYENDKVTAAETKVEYGYEYDELDRVKKETAPGGKVTATEYWNSGLVQRVTDPDGRVTDYAYNKAGQLETTTVTPGDRASQYAGAGGGACPAATLQTVNTYNGKGQLERTAYPDGRTVTFGYDALGRKVSETRSGEGKTVFDYDGDDLVRITDANGKKTEFRYDSAHRLVRTTLPGGRTIEREYDRAGFVTVARDPKGQEFRFANWENGRRKELWHGTTRLGTWTYDGNTPTSDGAVSWTLDSCGRVAACGGAAYEYGHPLGLLTRKTYGGVTLNYAYDEAGRLASSTDGTNSITYTARTPGGLPVAAEYSAGGEAAAIAVQWGYDGNWNLHWLSYRRGGETLSDFSITNDAVGRRTRLEIAPTGEAFDYRYDGASRLWQETRTLNSGTTATDYTYDAVGNRTKRRVNGALVEQYLYNDRNELTEIRDGQDEMRVEFAYDGSGNATAKRQYMPGETQPWEETTYGWDDVNRLTSATRRLGADLAGAATFEYAGGIGWQMNSQTVNSETRTFTWGHGGELLTETIPSAGTRTYVNGGVDRVLWSSDALAAASGTKFWLNDASGSVFGITDNTGSIIERQRYDAFGNTEVTQGGGIGNRLGFQGRTAIPEVGLQYFRNRFYDPSIGRFLSRDPLGLVDRPAVYAAFGGDPANNVDPMGTDDLYISDGAVSYQGETSFGIDRGDAIPIGTINGRTITLSANFGGGTVDYRALLVLAARENRGAATTAAVSSIIAQAVGLEGIARSTDPQRIQLGIHQTVSDVGRSPEQIASGPMPASSSGLAGLTAEELAEESLVRLIAWKLSPRAMTDAQLHFAAEAIAEGVPSEAPAAFSMPVMWKAMNMAPAPRPRSAPTPIPASARRSLPAGAATERRSANARTPSPGKIMYNRANQLVETGRPLRAGTGWVKHWIRMSYEEHLDYGVAVSNYYHELVQETAALVREGTMTPEQASEYRFAQMATFRTKWLKEFFSHRDLKNMETQDAQPFP